MPRRIILNEMDRARKEVDRVFRNFLDLPRLTKMKLSMARPKTDIQEKDKEFVVKVGLPGMKKTDLDINVSSDRLEVKAQHRQELKLEKKNLFKQELSYKGFYRAFPLPAKVMPDKSKALYTNGILEIHMPKTEAEKEMKPKHIKVL